MTNIFNCRQCKVNSERSSQNFTKLLPPNHAEYKVESVNGTQMDIKRKTRDVWNWEKHLFLDISSTNIDIVVSSLCQCVETHSTQVFWLLFQPLTHLRFNLFVIRKMFTTLLWTPLCKKKKKKKTTTSHHKQETFLQYPLQIPKQNRTRLFKHSHQFDYWNQPVNMRMYACYLDCLEAGLCCYLLVIHRANISHPLQLCYFHLWPIYWLSPII
jgi:hypothetical protein